MAVALDASLPSRGLLLMALRQWKDGEQNDLLSLAEVRTLLTSQSGMAVGLSEKAAAAVVEGVYYAHGTSVTCEQLVHLLVPLTACQNFEELTEAELGPMRCAWEALVHKSAPAGPPGCVKVSKEMLKAVATSVKGLTGGSSSGTIQRNLDAVVQRLNELK